MINLNAKGKWAIAAASVIVGILLSLSVNVNDNALDLLPGTAVKKDLRLLQQLGLVNRVIITLTKTDKTDPQELQQSTLALGKYLEKSDLFRHVTYHLAENFELQTYHYFQSRLPLFLSSADLKDIEPLLEPDGIRETLQDSFTLLNSPAGYALKNQIQSDPLGLTAKVLSKLQYLKAEYALEVKNGLFQSKDGNNTLILAESRLDLVDADAAAIIERQLSDAFAKVLKPGIRVTIIGSLPHTLANANSVKHDLTLLLPAATVLLLSLLLAAFRSYRALLVIALPFLAAPSAIGLTGLIFGKISSLALGFGIVLLGIAVDFAIHLYLGLIHAADRVAFQRSILKPILLATLTTTSVFIVLLFSEVPSHRQMATLSLTGVLLAVCYSWYLIPLIAPQTRSAAILPVSFVHLQQPVSIRWVVLIIWAGLLVFGGRSWFELKYNGNLQTLDAPSQAVIEDENFFRATWGENGDQAFIVSSAANLDDALNKNSHIFRKLLEYRAPSFQSIAPILPSKADQRSNIKSWSSFWQERMPHFRDQFLSESKKMGFSENAFSPFFESLETVPSPESLELSLPASLRNLAQAMIRRPAETDSTTADFLVATTVSADDILYPKLLELDKEPGITLLANKKWRDQVEKSLRHDIIFLSLAAAAVIAVIIFLSFRNLRSVIAVLAPVLSALSAMAAFSSITGKDLNMMHLLMGIMVIGLAVDYGIFAADSVQKKSSHGSMYAISICALSSLIGFGVLSFAQHPALHSLGVTVLVGIGAAWPTAVLVSPALLQTGISKRISS